MNWLGIAEFFGVLNRARVWLQGKKTYAVNVVQALGGLSVMLGLSAQMVDLAAKSLSLAVGWSDGVGDATGTVTSVQQLWAHHAVMIASFSAGFYAVTDAFSKMASYAARQRLERQKESKEFFK